MCVYERESERDTRTSKPQHPPSGPPKTDKCWPLFWHFYYIARWTNEERYTYTGKPLTSWNAKWTKTAHRAIVTIFTLHQLFPFVISASRDIARRAYLLIGLFIFSCWVPTYPTASPFIFLFWGGGAVQLLPFSLRFHNPKIHRTDS